MNKKELQVHTCFQPSEIVRLSNLEPRVSTTMSSSRCSRQADFCCHAATQSHSIIARSIKRCGYPGRHESCLSFHSRLFFPLFFSLCCLPTPLPRTHSASPASYATPSSPLCLCSVSFAPSLPQSCPLSSQNSQQWWCRFSISGEILALCHFPSLIYLSVPSFCFLGVFMQRRLISSIQQMKYPSLFAGWSVIVWCSCYHRLLPWNVSVFLD